MAADGWEGATPLKIVIVGPGAIGCLLAALLRRGGHDVWLLDRQADRARVIAKRGLWVSGVSGEFHASVHATANPAESGPAGLAILAVKSYDTASAARTAAPVVGPETIVLTLQNGLGNIETLVDQFGAERVLGGVTAQGATLIAPGQVRHAGQGATVIGELNGQLTPRVRELVAAFSTCGVQTEPTTRLEAVIWSKLAVNAGINAVATVARVRNGGLLESRSLCDLMRSAVAEAAAVAEAKGLQLDEADLPAYAESICQRTADNVNSMLQDVNRQRRTEVASINGVVVEIGRSLGLATPVNTVLTTLLHGIEQTYPARLG
jgi:2-dehydropantoate 2-reductase